MKRIIFVLFSLVLLLANIIIPVVHVSAGSSSVLYSIAFDGQYLYAVAPCYGIGQSAIYKIDYHSGNISGRYENPQPTYGMCRAMLFKGRLYTCVQYSYIRYGELLAINTIDMTESWRLSIPAATNPSGLCNDGEFIYVGFETDPAVICKINPDSKDIVGRYTADNVHNRIVNLATTNGSLYATTIRPVGSVLSVGNNNMKLNNSSDNISSGATGIDTNGENIYAMFFSDNESMLAKYTPELKMVNNVNIEGYLACFVKSIDADLYLSITSNTSMRIFKYNSENLNPCEIYYESEKDYCYSIIDLGDNKIAVARYYNSDIQIIDKESMQLEREIDIPAFITDQDPPENPQPVIQPPQDAQYQGGGQSSIMGNKSVTSIIGKSNKSGAVMEDIEIKSPDFKMTLVIPNKTVIKTKDGGNVVAIRVIELDCLDSVTGKMYELQPAGVLFSNNISLTINCNSNNATVCRLDNGKWVTLNETSNAEIDSLATYAVIKNKTLEIEPLIILSVTAKPTIIESANIHQDYFSMLKYINLAYLLTKAEKE